jgi:hypothetical protein
MTTRYITPPGHEKGFFSRLQVQNFSGSKYGVNKAKVQLASSVFEMRNRLKKRSLQYIDIDKNLANLNALETTPKMELEDTMFHFGFKLYLKFIRLKVILLLNTSR